MDKPKAGGLKPSWDSPRVAPSNAAGCSAALVEDLRGELDNEQCDSAFWKERALRLEAERLCPTCRRNLDAEAEQVTYYSVRAEKGSPDQLATFKFREWAEAWRNTYCATGEVLECVESI